MYLLAKLTGVHFSWQQASGTIKNELLKWHIRYILFIYLFIYLFELFFMLTTYYKKLSGIMYM